MSGLVGHTMYGVLALQKAEERKLPVAPILRRHLASYLAGAYIGCDIQTMPESICVDTGKEVGFGTAPLTKSPITGGPVKPWTLAHEGREYRPTDIHHLFYGRSHLVFGWYGDDSKLAIPWDHLPDYCALTVRDWRELREPSEHGLAWLFGWMVHIVGDSLIKSIRPGIKMQLLDGTYTPRNRPIQDLYTFHEVGVKELKLDWAGLFADMAATPVEAIQPHYMRVDDAGGMLAKTFSDGWEPELSGLLQVVMKENHRWLAQHAKNVLKDMALTQGADGPVVCETLSAATGGLSYTRMMELAEKAEMRGTLDIIATESAALFERVIAQGALG